MPSQSGNDGAETGWRQVFVETLSGTRAALARFPVSTLFLFLAALNASLAVADIFPLGAGFLGRADQEDLSLALVAGALGACAATLFCEAHGWRRWALVAAFAAGLAGFVLMWPGLASETVRWTLALSLVGLVVVAPFLGAGTSGAFWMFGARLVFAALLALLSLLLCAGGISAILASLTHLFGLDVPRDLYTHVWLIAGLFVAPLFGLGQVPRGFSDEPGVIEAGFIDRGMRALGEFVAAPLLLAYSAILHAYAVKIIVTGAVPSGQVGWLVLTFGTCIFGVLIVCKPFLGAARVPTRLFLRFWPFLLVVPLALLFYALALRVGAHGLTVDRVLLGLFGAVAAVLVLLQCVPRWRGDTRFIAALPVLALFLASWGPQGALSLSLVEQERRFRAIVADRPLDPAAEERALAALRYLRAHDALKRVPGPDGAPLPAHEERFRTVAEAWGLDPARNVGGRAGRLLYGGQRPAVFRLAGFDIAVQEARLDSRSEAPFAIRLPGGGTLSLVLKDNVVTAAMGGETTRFSIAADTVESLYGRDEGARLPRLTLESGSKTVAFVATRLYVEMEPEPRLVDLSGTLLLRDADWQ